MVNFQMNQVMSKARMIFPALTPPITIIQELGIESPEDIDLNAIAIACGAVIVERPLVGCDARIIGAGDRAIITVRADAMAERKRFSAAHELGHWMRDRGKAVLSCESEMFLKQWSSSNPEAAANRFAADLLLPRVMFQDRNRGLPINWVSVKKLAKMFQTSLTATAIRLAEYGEYPGMIVCTTKGKRDWFVRGRNVPDAFWPYDSLQRGSVAIELAKKRVGEFEGREVSADAWINMRDSSEFSIIEDSWKVTDDTVLSLLWWKNEYQIVKYIRSSH